jgi:hypothetical protein
MSFEWSTETDSTTFQQLSSIIKSGGLFKSAKQASFLCGKNSPLNSQKMSNTPEEMDKFFGVHLDDDEFCVQTHAYVRWANYGSKSRRPLLWIFVLDSVGVVRQYKIRYSGNMRDGTRPDPDKTELMWTRPEGQNTSHLIVVPAEQEATPRGDHVGQEGERLAMDITIQNIIDRGEGDFGHQWLTIATTDDGNRIYYHSLFSSHPAVGERMHIRATIKQHFVTKTGIKGTSISRPHRDSDDKLRQLNPTLMAAWLNGNKKEYKTIRELMA